jgi:hypothetical protein
MGGAEAVVIVVDGDVVLDPDARVTPTISFSGPDEVWAKLLARVPHPLFNDVVPALERGLRLRASPEEFWQYYPAVQRAVDLLRDMKAGSA